MREKDEDKMPPGRRSTRLKTAWGSPFGGNANFDSIKDYDNEGRRAYEMNHELFALVLAQREGDIKHNKGDVVYNALIVASEGKGSTRMRRVDRLTLDSKTLGNRKVIEDTSEFATVTLI